MRKAQWTAPLLVGLGFFAGLAAGCSDAAKPAGNTIDPATGGRIDPATGQPTFMNDPALQKNAGGQQIPAAPKMPAALKGKAGMKLDKK